MLRDKEFSRNAAVDRYGRKLARDDTKKQLERFYRLDEADRDEEEEEEEGKSDDLSVDDDEAVRKELRRVEKRDYDPARGGGFSESSSSEESSSEEEEEEEDDEAEELEYPRDQQADVPLGEVTNRIAVVNLDWDNIRAEDLMAVFSSFVPQGGRVVKVSIYPSEFGKERMEREELEGPPKEIFASKKRKDDDDDSEEEEEEEEEDEDGEEADSEEEEEKIKQSMLKEDQGEEFNSTKLRRYQLERLRYFYAVLEFSSKEVAKHVYDAVDGTEYLSSANFFDLRFVPDDMDFSEDTPRDECDRIPDGYRPNEFVTDALQHSKVKLTWDADDKARKDAQARAFKGGKKEIDENDLKAYLGSDSSDDEEEVEVVDGTNGEGVTKKISKKEAERQRLRALLGLSDEPSKKKEKGPVGEMEITFTSGLSGGPENRESVFENEPEHEETTMEKYIRKERERRRRRKERIKALKRGETLPEAGKESGAKEGKDEKKEPEKDLGFDDPFFNDPEPAKQSASARRKEEKRKKREEREAEEAANAAQRAELELLMVDDKNTGVKHFDMNEIEKAEKRARKKGKKGQKGESEEPVDDFKIDVNDPRFARLYESHEYAIDPTNPRFRGTSGMKALLEEGRKRRRMRNEDEEGAERGTDKEQNKKQKKDSSKDDKDELKKLVAKVKGKALKA